ncbi:hypothetical protein [Gorillibacterium massiliense]|uniref:hypothetical protein n=1 Tax=Gorillibacterium massiliense TaxID=1280390 RepID=UPI0004B02A52|nr:hypothetical protein [Gorillibacterium massiliense]
MIRTHMAGKRLAGTLALASLVFLSAEGTAAFASGGETNQENQRETDFVVISSVGTRIAAEEVTSGYRDFSGKEDIPAALDYHGEKGRHGTLQRKKIDNYSWGARVYFKGITTSTAGAVKQKWFTLPKTYNSKDEIPTVITYNDPKGGQESLTRTNIFPYGDGYRVYYEGAVLK